MPAKDTIVEQAGSRRVDALQAVPRQEVKFALPVGVGAVLAAAASMTICYATIVSQAVIGMGLLVLNPHLQAMLMWGFALVAVAFLWRDRARHGSNLPLALGGVAALTLIITLYLGYDPAVEALAYALLVIATLLNQNIFLGTFNRTVRTQALRIEELNQELEAKVERQQDEIGRLARLKSFLAPQVAELVVDGRQDRLLDSHRRYVACLFCDIRNFTAASEAAEPEDVIALLQAFHDRIGELVAASGGTIGFRAGDGLMVFFNDPLPCETPVQDAVRLAIDIREAFTEISAPWAALAHPIGIGIGIASGHVTLGLIGFRGGAHYSAIGGAVNVAARLCDAATDGQILISRRASLDAGDAVRTTPVGPLELKGLRDPVETFSVEGVEPISD